MNTPTPETDANQVDAIKLYTSLNARIQCHLNFARKLERERDEARGLMDKINADYQTQSPMLRPTKAAAIDYVAGLIHELTQLRKVCDELAQSIQPVLAWWAFNQAQYQLENDGAAIPETMIALSFMGSGASTNVTVKELNKTSTALTNYSTLPHVKAKGNKE